jgi:quercetin 2,3-dioxygenase
MSARTVKARHGSIRDDIDDLVTRRPLPNERLDHLDPFLFLNHHGPQVYPKNNRGLPFGPHPHRGFETVTFIVEGSLLHRDTGGHESAIHAGGVQWMTAGRGLEHAEVSTPEFLREGGPLEILQLWVNLPARLKFIEPRYTGLQKEDIPSFRSGGATIDLVSGQWEREVGPVESLTGLHMMVVDLPAGSSVTLPAPRGRTVFFYIVRGSLDAGEQYELVDFNDDGDSVDVEAKSDALMLFGHGEPFGEPIVAHGPFVMNTREEIVEAFRDYQMGRFRNGSPGLPNR